MPTPSHRFLVSFAGAAVALPALFLAVVAALAARAPAHLPPPPISNRRDFDEKLRLLREQPDLDPELLGLGSSVASQHLDLRLMLPRGRDRRHAFNGGAQGLGIHQTRFAARYYADRFPNLRMVVVLLAPLDYRECRGRQADFVDPIAADRYAFERAPLWSVYLRHFDLAGFATGVRRIAADRRPGADDYERLAMDSSGFLPMRMTPPKVASRGLRYVPRPLDPSCFDELAGLVRDTRDRNLRLLPVINPIHPRFAAEVPGAAAYIATFRRRIATALAAAGAAPYDASRRLALPAEAFYDAYHLQPWAARRLSLALAHELAPEWGDRPADGAAAGDGGPAGAATGASAARRGRGGEPPASSRRVGRRG